MQELTLILLVVLIAAVVVVGLKIASGTGKAAPQVPTTVLAPPVDIAPIIEAVKAALDVNAISTGVQGAVESKIREVATDVLSKSSAAAGIEANERLDAQRAALEAQTQNLLQPFVQQIQNS